MTPFARFISWERSFVRLVMNASSLSPLARNSVLMCLTRVVVLMSEVKIIVRSHWGRSSVLLLRSIDTIEFVLHDWTIIYGSLRLYSIISYAWFSIRASEATCLDRWKCFTWPLADILIRARVCIGSVISRLFHVDWIHLNWGVSWPFNFYAWPFWYETCLLVISSST